MHSSRKESISKDRKDKEVGDGWVSTLLWVGGMVCAWAAVEVAFKPLLQAGHVAIRKSLDPNYDVGNELDNNSSNPQQGGNTPSQPAKDPQNDSLNKSSDPLHWICHLYC
ncbi:hypothetical protein GOP47_0025049 [Adiantum capillus-veneris]|uniref:Uncharacterized protein n=1 Tax=Adiantum capillus-veneris TaxID=13818 RepID=A0A9D4U546_ADICA|nr:hypothetical protein GOP47_0025049 [Adiantum capillus-veneris]